MSDLYSPSALTWKARAESRLLDALFQAGHKEDIVAAETNFAIASLDDDQSVRRRAELDWFETTARVLVETARKGMERGILNAALLSSRGSHEAILRDVEEFRQNETSGSRPSS
jgi:hypothetical protein